MTVDKCSYDTDSNAASSSPPPTRSCQHVVFERLWSSLAASATFLTAIDTMMVNGSGMLCPANAAKLMAKQHYVRTRPGNCMPGARAEHEGSAYVVQ